MILQPKGSRSCGQHAIANLANIPIEESFKLFGKKGATRTLDLIIALEKLKYRHGFRLATIRHLTKLPTNCLIKVRWTSGGSHWVVYTNGLIVCSIYGVWAVDMYFENNRTGKLSSYLWVNES